MKKKIAILARVPATREMERKAVSGIMLTLLLIGMLTLTFDLTIAGVDDTESIEPVGATGVSVTQAVDWWPMFRHDLSHTGYSTSEAPNTNNIIWHRIVGPDVQRASPAVVDGVLYIGSGYPDHKIYALNRYERSLHMEYHNRLCEAELSCS